MNLVDPADAYRRLDAREKAATARLAFLTVWADAANRDLEYFRRHADEAHLEAYGMALATWAHIDAGFDEEFAELAWIDAERNVLDQDVAAAGLDRRDYDGAGE